jgi:excisionase family DNA binding protein
MAVRKVHKESAALPIGERLLTLREAAEVLRMNPRTVREYVRRKELQGRLISRRWRFRRTDLDTFFENAPREWDFGAEDDDGD